MKNIFIIIIALFFSSCISPKEERTASLNNAEIAQEQIAFFTFKIYKILAEDTRTIELISKNIVDGSFKKNVQEVINYENYLNFEIYNDGELINSIKIEHPLYKSVEYFADNEFKSQVLNLDEQEFYIRLAIKNKKTQIKIIEKLKNNTSKELLTINL